MVSSVFVPVPDADDSVTALCLDLSGYDPQAYNILSPVLRVDTAAPYLRFRAVEVRLSPDVNRGDCYAAPGTRWVRERGGSVPALVAPAKPGLLKIASAAGLVIDPVNSRRITPDACARCIEMAQATRQAVKCGECASRFDCAYQHIGAVRTDTGWRIVKASYEWNLDAQRRKLVREAKKRLAKAQEEGKPFDPEEYLEDRLDQITSERYGLAETKSLLRLVRAICHLRQAYSREEMARPFVVVRTELAPDFQDPVVRQALAQKAIASGADIFTAARETLPALLPAKAEVIDGLAEAPDFSEAEVQAELAGDLEEEDAFAGVPTLSPDPLEKEPVTPPTPEPKPAPRRARPAKQAAPVAAAAPEPGPSPEALPAEGQADPCCDDCGKPITPNVIAYCQSPRGKAAFGGASYCYLCQRSHRAPAAKAAAR